MRNISILFDACSLFEKYAQHTKLDKELAEGYVAPVDHYNYQKKPKKLEQIDIFHESPKKEEQWKVNPETGKEVFQYHKYPDWHEIEMTNLTRLNRENKDKLKKEKEKEEILSQEEKLTIPEIEPYHFPEQKEPFDKELEELPPQFKDIYKERETSVDEHSNIVMSPAQKTYLDRYNKFKESLKVLLEKYQEANALAEEQPELDDTGPLTTIIHNCAQHAINLIRWAAASFFGDVFNKESRLSKYLHLQFNPFAVNYKNLKAYLYDLDECDKQIKEILDQYKRMKQLEGQVVKNMLPAVKEFLSNQDNIDLLNWTDENNPDGKKQFIEEFEHSLYKSAPHQRRAFQRVNKLQHFSIYEMKSIKTFKNLYEKLTETLTTHITGQLYEKGEEHIKKLVGEQIKSFTDVYQERFGWLLNTSFPTSESRYHTADKEMVNLAYNRLKEQIKEIFQVDIGTVEQYLKNVVPKRIPKEEPGQELDPQEKEMFAIDNIIFVFKIEFLRDIKNLFIRKQNDYINSVFSYINVNPKRLIGKDISNIVSNEIVQKVVYNKLRDKIIKEIPGIRGEHHKIMFTQDYGHKKYRGLNQQNIMSIEEIFSIVQTQGGASFKNVLDLFKESYPEVPEQIAATFIKYCFRENRMDFISKIADFTETGEYKSSGFKILIQILKKFNKLEFNNLVKHIPMVEDIGTTFKKMVIGLPSETFTGQVCLDLIVNAIRSLASINADLGTMQTITDLIHNEGANLPPAIALSLFKNPNMSMINKAHIVKKVFKAVISIINMGGIAEIKKKYAETIKGLIKGKLVSRDIFKKMQFLTDLFMSGQELNPSNPSFKDVFRITSEIETELAAIEMADTYKELFTNYEEKKPELFKLDMKINDRLRFRVLKDRDPRHLRVGLETGCCQRIGGVGETAARDSFVNPWAGVLILEWLNNDNEWILLTQSYFHYVEEGGAILDNVEINNKNVSESDINLPEVYAWYANKIQKKMKLKYFLAGKGYSDLDTLKFGTDKRDEDPRYFSPKALTSSNRSHYSDYDESNGMDLNQPLFEIKHLNPQSWGNPQPEPKQEAPITNIASLIRRRMLESYAIAA